MAASGVGQFSINVKSNLKSFYGDLVKSKKTMDDLTKQKHQLQIDSSQLDKLRDKSQRIAAEMKELRQQKTEIKLGMRQVEDAEAELNRINQQITSLNRQKLQVDAEIQPIRTANVELYKVEQEIDRINGKKIEIDISEVTGKIGDGLDGLSNKIIGLTKVFAGLTTAKLAVAGKVLMDSVNAASDLEQNLGGVNKLFEEQAETVTKNAETAYKRAGISQNEYLEQATSFSASLISSLGGDQEKAAQYVDKALVDMSDNVNTFGTNVGLVQNAYEGFAKGNYTMLDNLKLGFGGSQQGAMDLVNAYGRLDKEVTDISEVTFPILIQSIHNAQEAMNISGATAKEAASTYEGSFKTMQAAWQDFLATGDVGGLAEAIPIYLENLGSKLKELTPKIIDGVKTLVKELPPKLKPIFEEIQTIFVESIDSIFGEGTVDNFVKGMEPFVDIIGKVFDMLSNSTDGEKPDLSWVGSVIPTLLKAAVGLKAASLAFKGISFAGKLGVKLPSFGGFAKTANDLKQIGPNDLKSLGMKMLTIAGISANIYLAAKALQQVQNVGDLGDLQPKLLAIAEAIVGMGLIATAAGKLDQLLGGSMKSGLLNIALIAADIFVAAKALQEVGSIDSDFGSIQSKIGQIALSITEIGILATAVGAVMSTGLGVILLVGLASIAGIAVALFLTAKALKEVQNAELDNEKINTNIGAIKSAVDAIAELNFGGDVFSKLGELINSFLELGIVRNVSAIGDQLSELQGIEVDNDKVKEKISAIKDAITSIGDFGFESSVFSKLGELINSFIETAIVSNIVEIGNQLNKLQEIEIDQEAVKTNLTILKESLNSIADMDLDSNPLDGIVKWINSFIDEGVVANLIGIAENLEELQKFEFDKTKITDNIAAIKEMVEEVTSGSLVDSIKGFISGGVKEGEITTAAKIIKELKRIGDSLLAIQNLSLDETSITEKINIIKNAIESISAFATDDIVDNLTGLSQALDEIIDNLTSQYPPEFNKLGQMLAKKLTEGFKAKLDLKKVLSDEIKGLSADGADTVGKKIAESINRSLANNLDIDDTIRDAINSALQENYSTDVDVNVNVNNPNEAIPVTIGSRPTTATAIRASGGLITQKQVQLEDSPEKPLLQNGEYVIPKKIVNALGVPFFDRLRSGQVSRTFAGLARSVSNTTSNVVNNVYNNTTNQNNNMYLSGQQDLVLVANRRFRQA